MSRIVGRCQPFERGALMQAFLRNAIFCLTALMTIVVIGLAGPQAHAESNVLFILDASGSMKKNVDGKSRIDIARSSLISSVLSLPSEVRVGLMIYGARRARDCRDIQLVSPVQSNDRDTVILSMAGLQAKGETPIADSIMQGARSLAQLHGQHNSIVILTDGIEECRGDPCAAAAAVSRMGIDLKISIIGFTLGPKERRAIECVPNQTGGKYYEARDTAGLTAALADVQKVATPAPPPPPAPSPPKPPTEEKRHVVIYAYLAADKPYQDVAGPNWNIVQLNDDGTEGQSVLSTRTLSNNVNTDLRIGKYKLKATIGLASAEEVVDLATTKAASFNVVLNAGTIRGIAFASKDKPIESPWLTRVRWDVAGPSGATAGTYGGAYAVTVPAGDSRVKAQIGNAETTVPVQVQAGEVVEVPMVLGVGHLSLSAKASNRPERLQGVQWQVLAVPDGGAVYGDTNFTGADYNLKAGQYKVTAKLGQQIVERVIDIAPGQSVEHQFVFEAFP